MIRIASRPDQPRDLTSLFAMRIVQCELNCKGYKSEKCRRENGPGDRDATERPLGDTGSIINIVRSMPDEWR
jgi:hypothetical protein